jgi:4-hydroxy 2-oxovalerate aldolase
VSYNPDYQLFDCTIRDGGLINDHQFEDGFVRGVYETCVAAGLDYMELGYKGSKRIFAPSDFGGWKFCDEDTLRRIVDDNPTDLKLSVMADVDRTDYKTDILPKSESVIDCVRVACYIHQIPAALDMVQDAHDKGYETCLNIMAVSTVQERELRTALELAAAGPVGTLYIVDSFGTMYMEQIDELVGIFKESIGDTDTRIGIHAHNNQQLAYANTIQALIGGATKLDATINGLGRGAGNCTVELLIGFLKNPKFKLRPILKCIQDHFLPMEKDMEWGYKLAYMLTGQLNQHPRAAIKWRAGETPDDIVAFYDQVIQEV